MEDAKLKGLEICHPQVRQGTAPNTAEDEEEGGGSMPVIKSLLCVRFLFLTYDGSITDSVISKNMSQIVSDHVQFSYNGMFSSVWLMIRRGTSSTGSLEVS